MITIAQFSDLHLSHPGNRSHGGLGYDTDVAWDAVFAHAFEGDHPHPDFAVITGDIADHGETDEYQIAARALQRIPVPTNLLAGNHDFEIPLQAALPRPGLSMDRSQHIGNWLFLFLDSNAEHRTADATGRLVDTAERIETNGLLGAREIAWVDDMINASDAAHVWLWMHHPPAMAGTFFHAPNFDREIEELIGRHDRIRGMAGGHVHTDMTTTIADRPVYLCPALTVNLDLTEWKTMPPGYRRFTFADDGAVTSTCEFVAESDHWPVFDLPDAVISYLQGNLSWDDMQAEVATILAGLSALS